MVNKVLRSSILPSYIFTISNLGEPQLVFEIEGVQGPIAHRLSKFTFALACQAPSTLYSYFLVFQAWRSMIHLT